MDGPLIKTIPITKPTETNFILGQSHFIKTVEDIHEAIVNTVPHGRFGIAFCEASGACKVRSSGNDKGLQALAEENALALSCGHCFIIFMEDMFPLNILKTIKDVPEVCHIFCATANPTQVILAENTHGDGKDGRGILGVIDGYLQDGIEDEDDKTWRQDFLRQIGYKQ